MNTRPDALFVAVLLAATVLPANAATDFERELVRQLGALASGTCVADPMKVDTVDARLFAAAHCGDLDEVRRTLDAGANVHARQGEERNNGRTALHYAAGGGRYAASGRHVEVARLLVARGADVNAAAQGGYAPLHVAAGLGQRDMVEFLLKQGANVNAQDIRGTPILGAVGNGHDDVVALLLAHKADTAATMQVLPSYWEHPKTRRILTLLLDAGVDLNAQGPDGRTALDSVLGLGEEEKVLLLLSRGARVDAPAGLGAARRMRLLMEPGFTRAVKQALSRGYDIRARDSDGGSPVHHATYGGPAMIDLVLAHGARFDDRDAKGDQPIHYAVRAGKTASVEYLLKKGASVNAEGADGSTPIMYGQSHSDAVSVTRVLLAHGANVNHRNRKGYAALDVAPGSMLPILIKHGANVKASDAEGNTVLHRFGDASRVHFLASAGADVNAATRTGRTPLHVVSQSHADPRVITTLVSLGAKVDARDVDGATPLHRAASFRHEAVRELLKAGASIDARDNRGRTPLHYAAAGTPQVTLDLLARGADINARDADGKTPLDAALAQNNKLAADFLVKAGATR